MMLELFLVFFVLTLAVMFLMSWMGKELGETREPRTPEGDPNLRERGLAGGLLGRGPAGSGVGGVVRHLQVRIGDRRRALLLIGFAGIPGGMKILLDAVGA